MSESVAATSSIDLAPDLVVEEHGPPSWAGVFSLTLGVFGLVTAEFLPVSLLTPIAADLGITDGVAGQTVTATAVIGAFAGLATPILTGRLDRRLVMLGLTLLLVVSSLLAAIAGNLAMLLTARLLLGIGLGGFWSMVAAIAMRLVPSRLVPRALSMIFAGVSVATVSAAPLGAYLGDLFGWRMVFAFATAIGLVTLTAQLASLPRLPSRGAPDIGTLIALLGRGSVRLVLVTILLVISGHFAGFTYVRPFLEQVPRFSVDMVTLVLLAYGIGGFLGNFVGAAIVERSAPASVASGAILIAAMALALSLFGGWVLPAAAGIALWGFAFGMVPVGVQSWIVRAAPDQPEAASGLVVAAFQVAIASGAVFGGLAVDGLGPLGAIFYAGIATLLGALCVAMMRRA